MSQPKRFTVWGRAGLKHLPDNGVYVGRPSKWGNPFHIGVHGDRAEVIRKYRCYLLSNAKLLADLGELHGKDLGCWCKPGLACHADVLLELANREESSR